MNISASRQNALHIAIIAAIVLIAIAVYPQPNASVQGIYLPKTSKEYPARPADQVQVITQPAPREQLIGEINAALHLSATRNLDDAVTAARQKLLKYARQQAAQAGGNRIIVGYNIPNGNQSPLDSLVLRAYVFNTNA